MLYVDNLQQNSLGDRMQMERYPRLSKHKAGHWNGNFTLLVVIQPSSVNLRTEQIFLKSPYSFQVCVPSSPFSLKYNGVHVCTGVHACSDWELHFIFEIEDGKSNVPYIWKQQGTAGGFPFTLPSSPKGSWAVDFNQPPRNLCLCHRWALSL